MCFSELGIGRVIITIDDLKNTYTTEFVKETVSSQDLIS